jgi:hypothetical protein
MARPRLVDNSIDEKASENPASGKTSRHTQEGLVLLLEIRLLRHPIPLLYDE